METFEVQKEVLATKVAKIKQIVSFFLNKIVTKDNQINELQQKAAKSESRVTESENNSSKDCLIFKNMPISDVTAPIPQVCDFLKELLNFSNLSSRFKACHVLGVSSNSAYPPVIIVKFLYFTKKWGYLAASHG